MTKKKLLEYGIIRIKSSDLKPYILKNNSWVLINNINKNIKNLIENYSKNNNIHLLIDEDNNEFLKGYLDSNQMISGKRINILPNGKKLARGGFSIFAKNLKFNTNKKNEWDVCYENSSGLKTYLYSQEKIELEKKRKRKIVNSFIKEYPNIIKKLEFDVKNKKKVEYLALYILIKTYMRVGNLEYYNHLKHKGLTTLQKKDIKIDEINNQVIFEFIGKDGVPQRIEKEFENFIIVQLKKLLDTKKDLDFVFTDLNSHPIHSQVFSKILFDYTNKHFYPHIIRSFYADTECRKFIKNHKKPLSKKIVIDEFKRIGLNLGHKKYDKKKKEWVVDYKATIDNYIRPDYVEKMRDMYQKRTKIEK